MNLLLIVTAVSDSSSSQANDRLGMKNPLDWEGNMPVEENLPFKQKNAFDKWLIIIIELCQLALLWKV